MSASVDILVVDDRPGDLLAIRSILARPDYNLVTSASGTDALRRVLERDFAVILLDVRMPDLHGFEVASIIKQRERSRHTPIVFLTAATTDVRSIYRAYSVGAVDYLGKPIDADILRAKVAIFVELFRKDQHIKAQAEALRIADRRERELEIAELRLANERRYRNLAEAIPQIVWTAAPDGTISYFNQRWFEYTGQPATATLGPQWLGAVHPDEVERHAAQWRAARSEERVLELECRLRRHDGSYRWHLCRAVPERDGDGRIVAWLGTYTDFDDRRRALDAAHAAVVARDEFLSIASHELGTPLMTLRLRLDSLDEALAQMDEAAMAGSTTMLRAAIRQSTRLRDLVNSLLDVSRIATGRLSIATERFDLVEAVDDVVERFAEAARRVGCTFEVGSTAPVIGVWDRLRIEQVLQNLVANAIKYAPRRPVEIDVSGRDDLAVLTVTDHGIGIAPEDAERVFGQFERAVSVQHYGGLGMGLYIARQITLAHGGVIAVASAPGVGSTFTVTLPRQPPAPAAAAASPASGLGRG